MKEKKNDYRILVVLGVIVLFALAIIYMGPGNSTGYQVKLPSQYVVAGKEATTLQKSPCLNCPKPKLECNTLTLDPDAYPIETSGYTFCKNKGYTTSVSCCKLT